MAADVGSFQHQVARDLALNAVSPGEDLRHSRRAWEDRAHVLVILERRIDKRSARKVLRITARRPVEHQIVAGRRTDAVAVREAVGDQARAHSRSIIDAPGCPHYCLRAELVSHTESRAKA